MARSKPEQSPETPPPPPLHGPSRPARRLYGVSHLRHVVSASDSATIDQLCEDAAQRILKLRG